MGTHKTTGSYISTRFLRRIAGDHISSEDETFGENHVEMADVNLKKSRGE